MMGLRGIRKEVKRPSAQPKKTKNTGNSRAASRINSRATSPERDISITRLLSGDWEEAFDQAVDDLSEKRLSIREKALNQLIAILAHRYAADKLENSKETVVDSLKRCVKREKSAHENALGMRALALCFITLGPGHNALFQDLCFSLKYIITHTGSVELRVAGAIALAVACFVASEDVGDTYDLLDFFSQQLTAPSNNAANQPDAQRAILNAFGLLLTCVEDVNYAKQIYTDAINVHIRLLESPHTEVRTASGENIALMYELFGKNNVSANGSYSHTVI
ncbi:interferon-related developmental regulator-domain-containing protein [Syncephalis plumigaleata]|nr:interferon-related developmental regulator-domain-containing protein [Syncephalis plumigaleata]